MPFQLALTPLYIPLLHATDPISIQENTPVKTLIFFYPRPFYFIFACLPPVIPVQGDDIVLPDHGVGGVDGLGHVTSPTRLAKLQHQIVTECA